MIRKTTFREIRQSLGRYMAIMAIIALGVGIFAGLKATMPAMHATTQQYLIAQEFYDYRLLSTIGFDKDDELYFQNQQGVECAEGAYSVDILVQGTDGNEQVLKAHSLSENINKVKLLSGRMPEKPNECVVDCNLYLENPIGNKIILADSNTEEDLDFFAYEEYTIVGTIQSSLYIQFERGNTSLGNGKIAGFVYMMPNGFVSDYYTELYVKFHEDFDMYSQEYDAFLKEKEGLWEKLLAQRIGNNFNEIVSEAEEKIADAEEELAEEKTDAQAKLNDAKSDLGDAFRELTDAETEVTEGEREILDGKEKIEEAQKEIADAKVEIADNQQKLHEAALEIVSNEQTLLEKEAEFTKGVNDYNYAVWQVTQKEQELQQQEKQLADQREQVLSGLAMLADESATLDETEQQLNLAILAGIKSETDEEVIFAREQIRAGREQIAQNRLVLEETQTVIAGYLSRIEEGKKQISATQSQLYQAELDLNEGKARLEDARLQLQNAKAEWEEGCRKLEDGKAELEKAEQDLVQAKADISKAEVEIADAETEIAEGWKEYEEGKKEYEDALLEFETEIGDAETEIADAKAELADLETPSTYLLGRDTNVGYVCFESDSAIVEGVAVIFPVFFFLVAALVCMTTMNRMVEEQRTQIGVFKALGYGEGTIMSKYLFYSGSAAFMGWLIGFLAGTICLPKVIWYAYGIIYNVGSLSYVLDVPMAVLCLAASLVCSMGTTWLSCKNELSEVSAQLMRPKAPKAGKRVWLEYIPFVWNRLKFLHKVSIRNIFRYKKRFFMMIVGISGCTALLVVGFGLRDSIVSIATQQYEEIQIYDMGVVFADPVTKDTENAFWDATGDKIASYASAAEISLDFLPDAENSKGVNLIIMKDAAQTASYIDLHTKSGQKLNYPGPGEIVICRKLSEIYDIEVGDEVSLRDEEQKRIPVTVSGICENFVFNYVYISGETYEKYMQSAPEYKSIFLNLKEGADSHEVSAAFMSLEEVSSVTVNEDMQIRFSSMLGSLDYIVYTIIICAAALAFIVLYNLTNINITERIREIATIKVLGFYKKETSSYVFRENTVLSWIGAVTGLSLGFLLHRFVMSKIVVDMVSFDVHVKPVSYGISFLLTLVFSWLINRLMSGKLEKINMAESLKSVD